VIFDHKEPLFKTQSNINEYQATPFIISQFKSSSLLKKLLLIIYSPPCYPRYPRLYFFSRDEIKVFDENIPGFSPYNGLQWEPNGSRSK